MRKFAFLAILCATTACSDLSGPNSLGDDPFAPTGRPAFSEDIDGLIVGHRLMAANEYELALKAYLRAASEQGLNVDVLSALGSANLQLGRLGQAERLLRQALDADGTFVPAWNNLGVVLMEQGNYGEATEVFRRAFALDSGRSDDIRQNLIAAMALLENPSYSPENKYALMRRGTGDYMILSSL